MDLVYMNASKEDINVLKDYTIDLAYGESENDFECQVNINNNVCEAGYYLYFEGEEYGGIIDSVEVDTASETVTYKGRTWHGILNSKLLQPDINQDYLIVNGEANTVINELISRMGLSDLFRVSSASSGVNISNYKMHRYIEGYTGILKMLKEANGKLNVKFKGGFVELSASPLIDYSQDEQFDTDQISFKIQQNFKPINHVICLGKGDLKDRRVIHVYSDLLGNISGTQTLTGINEICTTYENSNTKSDDELIKGGVDIIEKSFASNSVDFSFDSNLETFDVNDIIGAKELVTGVVVKAFISKKVVKLDKYSTSISYECSGKTGSVASSGYPSSGSGATIIIDSALSTSSTNPVQNKVVTNALNNKLDKIGATNPITSIANDTVENWINLGCGTFWFTKTGCLINQPSQYGFLQNFVKGSDVHQVFYVQTGGQMYHRGGNAYGWQSSGWRKLWDDFNIDSELSTTSVNPVQNKAIATALNGKQATITVASGAGTWNTTYGGTASARGCRWRRYGRMVTVFIYDAVMTTSCKSDASTSIIATGLPKAAEEQVAMLVSIGGTQARRVGIAKGGTSVVWWWNSTVTANTASMNGSFTYLCE